MCKGAVGKKDLKELAVKLARVELVCGRLADGTLGGNRDAELTTAYVKCSTIEIGCEALMHCANRRQVAVLHHMKTLAREYEEKLVSLI